jgi:hypothetical protein
VNARLGERAVVHGGFQATSLKQQGNRTPLQRQEDLDTNKLRFYSGSLATDVVITDDISANAFVKFDQRSNRIDRDTDLFNESDGSQVVPFLDRIRSFKGGAELVYRLRRMNQLALGFKGEWTDRDLDFATPAGFLGNAILPSSAIFDDDTRSYSGYARYVLRPLSGLRLSGEFGFKGSPETSYIRELDDAVYWQTRASYTPRLSKPVTLSFFTRGKSGKNHDIAQLGESGGSEDRDFDRTTYSVGGTLTGSPHQKVTLFGSAFYHSDDQDYAFVRSTDLRSFEASPFVTVDFFKDQGFDYRSDLTVLAAGGSLRITERTDSAVTYSYTRSKVRFLSNGATATTISDSSRVRSDIHRLEVDLGHWFTDGLRVSTGYRFQRYNDHSPVTGAGVVSPFNLDTDQHTVVIGVTLNDDLFR